MLTVYFSALATLLICRAVIATVLDLVELEEALGWKVRDLTVVASAALVVVLVVLGAEEVVDTSRRRLQMRMILLTAGSACALILYISDRAIEDHKIRLAISGMSGYLTAMAAGFVSDSE